MQTAHHHHKIRYKSRYSEFQYIREKPGGERTSPNLLHYWLPTPDEVDTNGDLILAHLIFEFLRQGSPFLLCHSHFLGALYCSAFVFCLR